MNKRKTFASFMILLFTLLIVVHFTRSFDLKKDYEIYFAQNDALKFYHPEDLKKLSESLLETDFQKIEDFSDVPFVDKAVLSYSLSGKHQVKVFLQKPIMALLNQGLYKLVNVKGEIFSEIPQYKIPSLPVLRGEKFLIKKNRLRAVTLFKALPAEGVFSKKSFSEVLDKENMVFIFSGVNGFVYIGNEDVEEKIERLNKVVKYLRFHGIESKSLDARFKDRVVVSVHNGKVS